MTIAWGARVSARFVSRVVAMCHRLGIANPSWLMAVMWFESRLKPDARNPQSGATGLIQFMPNGSIKELGTTAEALSAMSAEDQLVFVERYFTERGYAGRMRTLADVYMAVFWPAAIGKPDDAALITDAASKAYVQNRGLDVDKDGQITKMEAASYVAKALAEGLRPGNAGVLRDPEHEVTALPAPPKGAPTNQPEGNMELLALLTPVAQVLFNAFAPVVQQKIAAAVDKHSDQPGVGQAVAENLSAALVQFAQSATGKTDPLEAVAVARQDAAVVAQAQELAENTVLDRLKQLAPLLQQTSDLDKTKWQAEREGKDAASARVIAEKRAGLWDMTRTLVTSLLVMLWGIAWGLGYALYGAISKDEPSGMVITALIGLAGPIWTGAIVASVVAIVAYRFDGTKEGSEQTRAVLDLAAQNGAAGVR